MTSWINCSSSSLVLRRRGRIWEWMTAPHHIGRGCPYEDRRVRGDANRFLLMSSLLAASSSQCRPSSFSKWRVANLRHHCRIIGSEHHSSTTYETSRVRRSAAFIVSHSDWIWGARDAKGGSTSSPILSQSNGTFKRDIYILNHLYNRH